MPDLDRAECDFTMPELMTTCGHCGHEHAQHRTLTKTYHVGLTTKTEHFCTTDCRNAWYLAQLRGGGM